MKTLNATCIEALDTLERFWYREATNKSDILIVFIAQGVLPQFHAVFRNSGYALATLLIRLSLTTSVYYSVAIGISSMVFALLLTIIYNKFYSALHE